VPLLCVSVEGESYIAARQLIGRPAASFAAFLVDRQHGLCRAAVFELWGNILAPDSNLSELANRVRVLERLGRAKLGAGVGGCFSLLGPCSWSWAGLGGRWVLGSLGSLGSLIGLGGLGNLDGLGGLGFLSMILCLVT